ncbi:MAG: hypothetical protein H6677_09590 [Candidatus Obscuribacterales bacterium]|nr:hypothetical protein [Cyanobacteria bacterium HKST-UBA01]MCB9468519.1 hypothetical protein [Candidatus Obscuribacterales bacterium]
MAEYFDPQIYIAVLVLLAAGTSALTIYAVSTGRGKGRFLCQDCRFNNSKDCLKNERPMAFECTSYRTRELPAKRKEEKPEKS